MRESDVPSVCRLHMNTLPTTIARIGYRYLSVLYTTLLRSSSIHAVLIVKTHSQIIGVITATKNLYETQRMLQYIALRPDIFFALCLAIVRRRVTIPELLERISMEREIRARFPDPYPTILTFFVDRAYQRQGIGTTLLGVLKQHMPKNTKLYVDTERANRRAQQWYSSHGFKKIDDIGAHIVYREHLSR